MTKSERKFLVLRSIGNFLLLFAIFGIVSTFGPALYYEVQFQVIEARGITYKIVEGQKAEAKPAQKAQPSLGDLLTGSKEQQLSAPDPNFSIVIPKIGASSVIYPNVDPSDENSFLPILMKGVAHAQGTYFPGQPGNIYLFAHSTDNFWDVGRYNAVFYLLKDLKPGDEIAVFFQGKRHNYFVTSTKTVDPNDVSLITEANTGNEQLILQTCWPPGTTWKRLLVFARPRNTERVFK